MPHKRLIILLVGLGVTAVIALLVIQDVRFPRPYILFRDTLHKIVYFRDREPDIRRVYDLKNIETAVATFYKENAKLPSSLAELRLQPYAAQLSIADPQTKEAYGYKPVPRELTTAGTVIYHLCGTFRAPSPVIKEDATPSCRGVCSAVAYFKETNPIDPDDSSWFWDHGIGEHCWSVNADEEGYKKRYADRKATDPLPGDNEIPGSKAVYSPNELFALITRVQNEEMRATIYDRNTEAEYRLEPDLILDPRKPLTWLHDNRLRIITECNAQHACDVYESQSNQEPWLLEKKQFTAIQSGAMILFYPQNWTRTDDDQFHFTLTPVTETTGDHVALGPIAISIRQGTSTKQALEAAINKKVPGGWSRRGTFTRTRYEYTIPGSPPVMGYALLVNDAYSIEIMAAYDVFPFGKDLIYSAQFGNATAYE